MSASESIFANFSDAQLADAWGPLKRKIARLDDRMAELVKEFDRRGLTLATGLAFVVLKAVSLSLRLDTTAVRAEMGDDWCARRCKASKRTTYTVAPVAQAAEDATTHQPGLPPQGGKGKGKAR